MTSLSCERCEAEVELGFETDPSANAEHRLQEVSMSCGVTTFLCYRCRKAWSKLSSTDEKFKKYALAGFRLRCWEERWKVSPGSDEDMKKGEALLVALHDMDAIIFNFIESWIRAGIAKSERAERA